MLTELISTCDSSAQKITIGRRGTHGSEVVVFDLSYLIKVYGAGIAILMVKRPQDETAYPAVTTQIESSLTWVISDVDTTYKGSGECEIFWYVDDALAKSVIYPLIVMRDIGETVEEPPDAYQTWVDHLTELGEETLESARKAAESEAAAALSEANADDYALKSEGFAVGEQNGTIVTVGSPYFENNAKFYAQQAQQGASEGGWIHFYIDDNGDLHYVKTAEVNLEFYLLNGDLHVRV